MVELLSPFVTKEIPCPSCNRTHEQRFFRQRAFIADKKESDQHVVTYKWLNDRLQKLHPPFYFLFFCPHCFYTDTTDEYSKPHTTEYNPLVLRAFKKLSGDRLELVESLGGRINYDDIDFDSAMCLHMLAYYIHGLAPEDMRDNYKLARVAMRIAWLYREQEGTVAEDESKPKLTVTKAPESHADETMTGLMRCLGTLEETVKEADGPWCEFGALAERRMIELAQDLGSGHPYDYGAQVNATNAALQKYRDALEELRRLCQRDVDDTAARGTNDGAGGGAGASVADLRAYLTGYRPVWAGVPLTERDALEQAIELFQKAISADTRLSSHDTYFKMIFLVADLMIRCDNTRGALKMIGGIYKSAMDARKRYNEQLRQPEVTESDRRRIQSRINRVNSSMEVTGDFRHDLLDRLMEEEKETIEAVIAQNAGAPIEVIDQALVEAGVPRELLKRLRERGGPLVNYEPAKAARR